MIEQAMFICRLFHQDQPFEQMEARLLSEGEMTIGRDPAADWTLTDSDGTLSRIHCILALKDGQILLRDQSTNGTYLEGGDRAPRDHAVALKPGQCVRLGALSILVDRADQDGVASPSATTLHGALSAPHPLVPPDWTDEAPVRPAHRDTSLIEAFCEGARIDASELSSEDPAELMKRIGAIYQQTVLGLATLMAERTRMKRELELNRTTIGRATTTPSSGRRRESWRKTFCVKAMRAFFQTPMPYAPHSRIWAVTLRRLFKAPTRRRTSRFARWRQMRLTQKRAPKPHF
jgi:predicted component of type VI protein secretion system